MPNHYYVLTPLCYLFLISLISFISKNFSSPCVNKKYILEIYINKFFLTHHYLFQSLFLALITITLCVAEQQHFNSSPPLDPLSINDLAKKPAVKLDTRLRKALLKVLTRLEEEDKQPGQFDQGEYQQNQIILGSTPVSTSLPATVTPNGSKDAVNLSPTASSLPNDINTKVNNSAPNGKSPSDASGSQIDFFQVPLLTAFTLHQDANGIPRGVVPIYTDPEQLERQKIQYLEAKEEARGEKNGVNVDKKLLELLKQAELFQRDQLAGRQFLPTPILPVNLPQNEIYQQQFRHQLQEQRDHEQQSQFRPRYIEPVPTQQNIQQQRIQSQPVQNNVIQPQKFQQQILRSNPQHAVQNQIVQTHQNQLQFIPQQLIALPPHQLQFASQQPPQFHYDQQQQQFIQQRFNQPQNYQIEQYRQQFFQPNTIKNQFTHAQLIPFQQYQQHHF